MARKSRKAYRAFLESQEWFELRRKVMARDGFRCRRCGAAVFLEVHHLTYVRFGGSELLSDLVTVCHGCHEIIHNRSFNHGKKRTNRKPTGPVRQ